MNTPDPQQLPPAYRDPATVTEPTEDQVIEGSIDGDENAYNGGR